MATFTPVDKHTNSLLRNPYITNPWRFEVYVLCNWVFSSNVTSYIVILTNFIKDFNFCGRLYFNILVAKPLSDLYSDSSSNFQSND